MLLKKPADIKSSEITPKEHYLNRRQFILSPTIGPVSAGIEKLLSAVLEMA